MHVPHEPSVASLRGETLKGQLVVVMHVPDWCTSKHEPTATKSHCKTRYELSAEVATQLGCSGAVMPDA